MSSTARAAIARAEDQVAYQVAKVMGELLTFTYPGGSVSCYGFPESGNDAVMRQTLHTRSQEDLETFQIMYQPPTGTVTFPPTGLVIFVDCTITDEVGVVYVIRKSTNDALRKVWTFTDCVRTSTAQAGVVGQ